MSNDQLYHSFIHRHGIVRVAGHAGGGWSGGLDERAYQLGDKAKQNPSFTWWVINRLAFLVGAVNLSTFAVYFLQARLGYVKEAAAAPASKLILIVGLFILLSTLPAGWLTDRFGEKRMVAIAGLVAVVGTIIALSIPSLPVIYVGGCIIGIGAGLFYTANWALGHAPGSQGRSRTLPGHLQPGRGRCRCGGCLYRWSDR